MNSNVDFSSVRTVKIHKEQFDAINKKAKTILITSIKDGKVISFRREDNKETDEIINKLNDMILNDMSENSIGYSCALDRLLALIKDRLETVNMMS